MNNPIIGDTFAEVYRKILDTLLYEPEFVTSPRGQQIHELKDQTFVVKDPRKCFYTNHRRSTQFRYVMAELVWYLTGDNSAKFISKFAKMWDMIKNPDGTVNSAYGYLLFKHRYNFDVPNQWQWAYESLVADKNTRQAVLHFNRPEHQFKSNKDFVCTMYGNFLIRDNKLHFTITMRSNDVIRGLPTDIPFFCLLHLNMYELLRKRYTGLEMGEYTHIVNSLHLYESHTELVKEMLEHEFIPMNIYDDAEFMLNTNGECHSEVTRLHEALVRDEPVITESESMIIEQMYKLTQMK